MLLHHNQPLNLIKPVGFSPVNETLGPEAAPWRPKVSKTCFQCKTRLCGIPDSQKEETVKPVVEPNGDFEKHLYMS